VRQCAECGRRIEDDFRYCPECGTPQRSKIVEYFAGDARLDGGWLRISAYLTTPRHIRLSIWRQDRAEAALSLTQSEARRLARFLLCVGQPRQKVFGEPVRRGMRALRQSVSRAGDTLTR
jgi:hypothetical protein